MIRGNTALIIQSCILSRYKIITTYHDYVCSKARVNTTPQEDEFVSAAAQNNQEGIYSLLQPSEDNDIVCLENY